LGLLVLLASTACGRPGEPQHPAPPQPAHPVHAPPEQRGTAFVGHAAPLLEVRLMAFLVADDDGGRPVRVAPADIQRWVSFANDVFRPAGIRFLLDERDLRVLRSTLINGAMGGGPTWLATKRVADDVADRYPDRLAIFFRHGPGAQATRQGFSWTDINFVTMPGWPDDTHCEHDHVDALAHELGHHLGLWHTFARTFSVPGQAAAFLRENAGALHAFDGDGLRDTAPDPGIDSTECVDSAEVQLEGVRVPLARRNVMSYYDERDSLSATQIRRARWHLQLRRAYRMKLPKNRAPGALQAEHLQPRTQSGRECVVQSMDDYGPDNWSGERQLFCGSEGPHLVTLQLPVAQSGLHRLELYTTRAPDFGIVQAYLDGEPLGAAFDAWGLSVLASGAVPLGERYLEAGTHELTFVVRGKNAASEGFHLGLDAIALVPLSPVG
jgi:hypothetical protein